MHYICLITSYNPSYLHFVNKYLYIIVDDYKYMYDSLSLIYLHRKWNLEQPTCAILMFYKLFIPQNIFLYFFLFTPYDNSRESYDPNLQKERHFQLLFGYF